MNNAVKLVTNTGTIWTFEDPALINREFALGFLYGGMFLLKSPPNPSKPYYITYNTADNDRNTEKVFSTTDELNDLYNHGKIRGVGLHHVQENIRDKAMKNMYTIALADPHDVDTVNILNIESPVFLQGLFTTLDANNIAYDNVLLYKPLKNGVAYDIEGLDLPDPI